MHRNYIKNYLQIQSYCYDKLTVYNAAMPTSDNVRFVCT